MSATTGPLRVLELRSVRGTGGGPEKTILHGAAMADPERTQVTVCYLRDQRDTAFSVAERAAATAVDYVEISERHSFDHLVWPRLRQLVADRKIDLIHAHDYKTDVLALFLSRVAGVNALSTAHGWTGHSARERLCYYPADKRILSRFPRLIAVSSEIERELVRSGADPARVTTVLNGIDHKQFRRDPSREAEVRAALGFTPADIVIGAVGRIEPQKRFDLLLETFAAVHARHKAARLMIVGDGSQKAPLEALSEVLGLSNWCAMPGHVTDIVRLHHAFDFFVQSSDYEGTPNAVLEAMAMETPIVATDAGGTSELVKNGIHGRVVPVGQVYALVAAIETAMANPDRTRAMVRRARARVEGELSFESRVSKVDAIFHEVVGRG